MSHSVVDLGSFFAGDGTFGVNSASFMNFISCLVSVRTYCCVKVSMFVMFLLNSCCFFFLNHCCFDFVSLASVLVVFAVGKFQSSCCAVIFIARDCNP